MVLGRDRELDALRRLLAAGRPAVVLGEAGVGKTATVRDAAERAGRRVVEGGSLSTLSWHPYLPFRRLLGRVPEGDPAHVAGDVERAVGDDLLLLDDLHWADRETRAAIPHLVGRIRIVATVRRGDREFDRTIADLDAAGFTRVLLEPLEHGDAVALVGRLRPGTHPQLAATIAARAGGNPLLIEEMLTTGEPSMSLRLAMEARLQDLSPAVHRVMRLLSLAGRPLPAAVLGPGGDVLVETGLARRHGEDLVVRHALLAEMTVASLDAGTRRELSLELATRHCSAPGERARHLAAGGALDDARRLAAEAARLASTSGERALHLELAASCAEGPGADEVRLAAAAALADADLCDRATRLLDDMRDPGTIVAARRHLYRSRAALSRTDVEGAHDECARGLALVDGTDTVVEAELALQDAQVAQLRALLLDLDPRVAERRAARALELAVGSGHLEAHARWIVGGASLRSQAPGWRDEFRRALELAQEIDGGDLEFRIAESLCFALLVSGEPQEGLRVTEEARHRAAGRGLTSWDRRLRTGLVGLHWHAGDLAAAQRACELLILESSPRGRLGVWTAQVLADVGRHDESLAIARQLVRDAHPTWQGLGEALWALCDAELAAGDPRRSLEAAEALRDRFGGEGPAAFARVTGAWARFDLGLAMADGDPPAVTQPISEGAVPELQGVALLGRDDASAASECFREAASLWRGTHFRGHLRCLWALGEAHRRSGDRNAAIATLEDAETVAMGHGEVSVLRRIRRSLRLAGVRRSVGRGHAGGLTAREREILGLVSEGLNNDAVARRLGIGRPTVERMLQSATRKLGARTRGQAAGLLARERGPEP